ncbi:hypothetical protein LXL04_033605 [Taraxacum kok-saghyz]
MKRTNDDTKPKTMTPVASVFQSTNKSCTKTFNNLDYKQLTLHTTPFQVPTLTFHSNFKGSQEDWKTIGLQQKPLEIDHLLQMSDSDEFEDQTVELGENQTNETNYGTQTGVQKSRSTKKRSKICLEFDEDEKKKGKLDQTAACKHCGVKYLCHSKRYGNKNLKNHLLKCKAYLTKKVKVKPKYISNMAVVKKTGARIATFTNCAENAKCESRKLLVLDVSTRWNSTYHMLEIAQAYEHAFGRYHLEDASFGIYVRSKNLSFPTSEDWIKARKLCHFLKVFDDITTRISGTKYVTSHTLVVELAKIRDTLRQQVYCDILEEQPTDQHLYDIAKVMKPKFDKYFGEIENMNLLLYFAFLLDPRNKEEFLDIILDDHYGMEGIDYVRIHASPSTTSSTSTFGKQPYPNNPPGTSIPDYGDRLRNKMKTSQTCNSTISDLDRYFAESLEAFDINVSFEILTWWKVNSPRFPILSLMAKDLLAIPISTVASESVFSTSGRVLDSYRSSSGDKTVECLICTQDWLRKDKKPDKEEDEEMAAQLDNEPENSPNFLYLPNRYSYQKTDFGTLQNVHNHYNSLKFFFPKNRYFF